MRKSNRPLIIAARTSLLARLQTQQVAALLSAADSSFKIEYRWIESEGDRLVDASLAEAGGKGLFVRAVERLLLDGQADLAVHSLKDLPAENTAGLTIAAVPARADVRDCLISKSGYGSCKDLPMGAKVGTSSPRRGAQLKRIRSDLEIVPLRGNVDTRLRKVLEGEGYDAALLARAGLLRAGFEDKARHPVAVEEILPAACQGALALQCRVDDHVTMRRCLPVNDNISATTAHAERAIVAGLGADCHAALGVYVEAVEPLEGELQMKQARQDRGRLHYRVRIKALSQDGSRCLEKDQTIPARHLGRLIKKLVAELNAEGAGQLLNGHGKC